METLLSPAIGLTEYRLSQSTAKVSDVLEGKTFYSEDKNMKTGTLPNRGSWSTTINPGDTIGIPNGAHSGSGTVYAKTFSGSGTTGDLFNNHDNWVNGHKARGGANVSWSISGNILTLNVAATSWLEGNESGGGTTQNFTRSFSIPYV